MPTQTTNLFLLEDHKPVRTDGEAAAVRDAGRDTSKAARAVSAAAPQAR
jgi:hypothetical protein